MKMIIPKLIIFLSIQCIDKTIDFEKYLRKKTCANFIRANYWLKIPYGLLTGITHKKTLDITLSVWKSTHDTFLMRCQNQNDNIWVNQIRDHPMYYWWKNIFRKYLWRNISTLEKNSHIHGKLHMQPMYFEWLLTSIVGNEKNLT